MGNRGRILKILHEIPLFIALFVALTFKITCYESKRERVPNAQSHYTHFFYSFCIFQQKRKNTRRCNLKTMQLKKVINVGAHKSDFF